MDSKPTYEELELKVKLLEAKVEAMNSLEKNINIKNSFLKMLFDTIPNPMFYKDIDGIYQHCNDAFSKIILGIPKEEIIGKTLYELPHVIPKEYADIYYEKDKSLFENPGEQFYEGKVKCSDGLHRDYHFYKSTFVLDGEVLGIVGIMLDVTDYKRILNDLDEKNKELSNLSITDSLTNIYNRRHFQEVFEQKLSMLNRHKHSFSFALIDIDFFKDYNDCYGHHAGDIALKDLAKVFEETFHRPNDKVFRVGGEEFAILFDVKESTDAVKLVEELKEKVENLKLKTCNTEVSPYMTISIGLGNIKGVRENIECTLIYDEIDKLLYASKQNGRNQVTSMDIVFD